MSKGRRRVRQLETCSREMFGDLVLTCQSPPSPPPPSAQPLHVPIPDVLSPAAVIMRRSSEETAASTKSSEIEKRRASDLVDQLLMDIYNNLHHGSGYNSTTSSRSQKSLVIEVNNLHGKDTVELSSLASFLEYHVERTGSVLVRQLKRRDALRRQQDAHSDVITGQLQKRAPENGEALRFTIQPAPGESGFSQWAAAMKMVAQLSGGIPPEFRRRLWLTLADRHLSARGVNWTNVERSCFSEWSHPTDSELGVQIVKDLHRTGCSLFCGEDGQENQALLKRVLLAYARWNKAVGYCQGFNMLAALILQVTDKCETDALKLMIYLIEGVLPDSYFADSLRGLSVDMAVFRELLRSRLPRLSRHLDTLQTAAKDGTTSYEPPLTNVFTMQWFLTLFCNCLPQPTVLRVWDLILLEGNEVLLRTALAIWQTLAERIMGVRSADEFYCIMGVLTRELLEFGLIDANTLIKAVVTIGPLTELRGLREHYMYNINPWGASIPPVYSNDQRLKVYPKERLVLDISALKKQYVKLKQRQRQAHIIFSAAISRQPPRSTPVAMNHLLLGKSALVPAKRLGAPRGTVPPARLPPSTLLWKDAPSARADHSSSSSSDTELCDDPSESSGEDEDTGDGKVVTPNLMNSDNTVDVAPEPSSPVVANNSSQNFPDRTSGSISDSIFDNDTPSTSIKNDLGLVSHQDSDDDSVDFERFLEDRVRCLKDTDGSRAKQGRRNSELALQIIQENSLILHRIMQCQSRLSPSPPIVAEATMADAITPSESDGNFEGDPLKFEGSETGAENEELRYCLDCSDGGGIETFKSSVSQEPIAKSPEYGSRYTSILEKSRSLDEKYHSLIINAPKPLARTLTDFSFEESSNGDNHQDAKESGDGSKDFSSARSGAKPDFKFSFGDLENSSPIGEAFPKSCDSGVTTDFNFSYGGLENSSPINEAFPKSFESPKESGATTDFSYGGLGNSSPIGEAFPKSCGSGATTDFSYGGLGNSSPIGEAFPKSCGSGARTDFNFSYGGLGNSSPSGEEIPKSFLGDAASSSESPKFSAKPASPIAEEFPKLQIDDYRTLERKSDLSLDLRVSSEPKSFSSNRNSPSGDVSVLSPVGAKVYLPKSPSRDTCSKSPNKIFNPFPVPLSSRQNKEVPQKLGLYKK